MVVTCVLLLLALLGDVFVSLHNAHCIVSCMHRQVKVHLR